MQKMRAQNFKYGADVPIYQSMTKNVFKQHDSSEAMLNLQ